MLSASLASFTDCSSCFPSITKNSWRQWCMSLSRKLSLQWLLSFNGPPSGFRRRMNWRISSGNSGWKVWERKSWGVYSLFFLSSDAEQHCMQSVSEGDYQCTAHSFWAGSLFVIVNLYGCVAWESTGTAFVRIMSLWRKAAHQKLHIFVLPFL